MVSLPRRKFFGLPLGDMAKKKTKKFEKTMKKDWRKVA